MIKRYLSNLINDHKTPKKVRVHNEVIDYDTQFGEWKIQLTMQINFISSKDFGETRTMHTARCNIEIMMRIETNDIIEELREFLLQNYQERKKSMRGSKFVRNSMDLLYYHLHKISFKKGRSYIDSPK